MCILYMAWPSDAEQWRAAFARLAPELEFRLAPDIGDPGDVRYLIAWESSADLIERFPNLRVLYSAGAGVDQFDLSLLPAHVPLVRLVDPAMASIMTEYVQFAVLALHRDILSYRAQQTARVWAELPIIPAARRRVGVMGIGNLGLAVLERLHPLGFQLSGWNRSEKAVPGGRCYVGMEQLPAFLAQCDILINLLPLTPQTTGILNRERLDCLPMGAGLVNVGRGAHLVEADVVRALDEGRLGGAILDVFEQEPPPPEHPFWSHPKVLMTPHVASTVQIDGAVSVILENLRRERRGDALLNVVDRSRGY
ncbi:2-hydroxyacid dehydrogenase [Pseudomonas vanderleydeniana]|uniref:Glyoxylate/hydroxypyruvate reductase A n=1 Tax=Pseudomonas vanderleydeniana TaxID=2745495 RepID=A0A9E6TUR2_9PSED|nr:glyoxylate/hydroxypyruvate reductase A [Pseudomonas vanderleydeniana]QXI30570.1 glyoxylate/hydroxypyruvate reductase A [Pseudomonas vanderleydeniana]